MNLLLIEPNELGPGGLVELNDARARHAREVLGADVGRELRVGVIDGPIGTAIVEVSEPSRLRLRTSIAGEPPPRPSIDLLIALPRPKVLRRLWPQLAALGVGTVVLVNANRVERFYFDSHLLDEAAIRGALLEGLAQAKDTRVPIVRIRRSFKITVEDELEIHFGPARRAIADPAFDRSIAAWGRESARERAVIALGPEGGWSAYERDLLAAHGFEGVGLGPRTLRSDTATIALLAVLHEARRAG